MGLPDMQTISGNRCKFVDIERDGVAGLECKWDREPSRTDMTEAEIYARSGGVTERCQATCGEMKCSRLAGHTGSHGHEIHPGVVVAPFPQG